MRNIPIFTTEYGVASLILKEIPYTQKAYVRLQSSLYPEKLLEECVGFCRAAGAEEIYATGHDALEKYPLQTRILLLEISKGLLPNTDAVVRPVLPEQADQWKAYYNQSMTEVDNAAYIDNADVNKMLKDGDGYFVYRNGALVGIGRAAEDQIFAVASCVRGGGKDTLLALAGCLSAEQLCLEVASTNYRAMRLYERLGFRQTKELSRWYKIL